MSYSPFRELPNHTRAALATLSAAVDKVEPVDVRAWTIDTATLLPDGPVPEVVDLVAKWAGKGGAFLYCFRCPLPPNLHTVQRAFADAKAQDMNKRAYARLNAPSMCFYVGGSQAVAKRLREHLGYGAAKTYALQFAHWAQPLSFQLEFVCAKYADPAPPEVIQALEDTLWDRLAPMFGRKGHR